MTLVMLLVAVAPAAAEDPPFSLAALAFKGLLGFRSNVHFDTTANDDQYVVNDAIVQLEWARRPGAWGSMKLVGEFRDDDFGYTRGLHFQIPETTERRSYLTLREAVVEPTFLLSRVAEPRQDLNQRLAVLRIVRSARGQLFAVG